MKTTSNIDVNNIEARSEEIVERFLTALVEQDHVTISELLHPDIIYTNVSCSCLTSIGSINIFYSAVRFKSY